MGRVKGAVGRFGEQLAVRHLEAAGLRILDRNWRCAEGEIDIVAADGDTLVVCEVKTRSGTGFGDPAEAVVGAKAARLRRLALRWLAARGARLAGSPLRRGHRGPPPGRRPGRAAPARGVLMTLARTSAVAVMGIEGQLVEIQADLADGLPGVTMIGLPDAALQEARDRIRAAIVNSGEAWPTRRMTLALLPATLPKRGSMFDVALAVAVLAAAGAVPTEPLADVVLLGELGLDGRLRPTRGTLPAVVAAARAGMRRVVVPAANLAEAALVPGPDVRGVVALADLLGFLRGEPDRTTTAPSGSRRRRERPMPDLRDVVGQAIGRRAVEIAAAGGHHLLFAGPPGSGKTMLAERLPGVLPPLEIEEALEVSAVHSVAGLLAADSPLVHRPPLPGAAPHGQRGGPGRRRLRARAARRGVAVPSRSVVPGRGAGVPDRRARRAAAAPGER